jgi:hypothetical protein
LIDRNTPSRWANRLAAQAITSVELSHEHGLGEHRLDFSQRLPRALFVLDP